MKPLSRVRLLATSWTAALQGPPSMGFSRQEYWSGVPLPSPNIRNRFPNSKVCSKCWKHLFSYINVLYLHVINLNMVQESQFSGSVMSDSLWPHGLQHTRLPCPALTPGACSNSCPSSQWNHPTISSSCHSLLLLPLIFPRIRVFSNESVLCITWPKTGVSEMGLVLPDGPVVNTVLPLQGHRCAPWSRNYDPASCLVWRKGKGGNKKSEREKRKERRNGSPCGVNFEKRPRR